MNKLLMMLCSHVLVAVAGQRPGSDLQAIVFLGKGDGIVFAKAGRVFD